MMQWASGEHAVLDSVERRSELRESWNELAGVGANVFSTWEWASVWWRHFGRGRPLLVRAAHGANGTLDVVLPLYLWSFRPFRIARFLGHGPADQLGPLHSPSRQLAAAAALASAVGDARLHAVFAELLPASGEWGRALGSSPVVRESSPSIDTSDGWDAYLSSRSANFRQQIGNRERRLARRYDVRFRLADDPERLPHDLTTLFALHRARWGPGSPFLQWEPFHRDFAAVALERGWLRLWMLELDGRSAAAWYGFRFSGVESYYQAGRDARLADEALGFVLLAHTIREAAQDGVREYRMLRGAEAFKRRFADDDPGLESFCLARGVRGRLASSLIAATLRSRGLYATLRRFDGRRGRAR